MHIIGKVRIIIKINYKLNTVRVNYSIDIEVILYLR